MPFLKRLITSSTILEEVAADFDDDVVAFEDFKVEMRLLLLYNSDSLINPRNTHCMSVVKIIAFLDLEQN